MRGAWLAAAGCAPFAAGAALGEGGIGVPCPFREATGLPCPFCGATRAFALAVRGDAGFLDYNAAWVGVAAVAVVAGLVNLRRHVRLPLVTAIAVAMALGWTYALVQRTTILGQAGVVEIVEPESPANETSATKAITPRTHSATPIQPSTMPAVALLRPPIRPPEPSISLRAW